MASLLNSHQACCPRSRLWWAVESPPQCRCEEITAERDLFAPSAEQLLLDAETTERLADIVSSGPDVERLRAAAADLRLRAHQVLLKTRRSRPSADGKPSKGKGSVLRSPP